MPRFLEVATHTSVARIEVVPMAPTVFCVRVAPHGAWSKNLWASSRVSAMFETVHFKTDSGEFSAAGRALTMRYGQLLGQPCVGGG